MATNPHDATQEPLIALVGPTASGKTALALTIADRLPHMMARGGVEIVSADSRQIYRLMDIATAKPTVDERARVPHHLLDMVWPDESYTLAEYQRDAQAAIAAIQARERLPMLVGGTGLYVRAVVDGLAIPQVAPRLDLRAELEAEAMARGAHALTERLQRVDPASAARIDPGNVRRLIRAIEVSEVSGKPFSEQQGSRPTPYATALMLGLAMDRKALYARADERIEEMMRGGLVEETRALVERGYSWALPSMSSLGYREMGAYLRGELTLAAATEHFKFATHAYIRRQMTWFRADPRIHWLNATLPLHELASAATEAICRALATD
ncbi:MAG TPA: tRNA (adenosine(37)-N6)-dimethylallyltransferase MiaA [Ktedonobacterales bacterium]|nr:tRNA (adenosine(37)-N6)-dimethylallyltransferase MiaA [Ktedonobacterales bacterium]